MGAFFSCVTVSDAIEAYDLKKMARVGPPEKFTYKGCCIQALVTRVIDGDTIQVLFRHPVRGPVVEILRLSGVDTPEMKADTQEERQMAVYAKQYVEGGIGNRTVYLELEGWDKYKRVLGYIYRKRGHLKEHEKSFNLELIARGFGVAYKGGKKKQWVTAKEALAVVPTVK